MRESTGLESVKDGNRKQGAFEYGMTVSGQWENTRPGGEMERSVGKGAAESSQPCRKGQNSARVRALEEAHGEFRLKEHHREAGSRGGAAQERGTLPPAFQPVSYTHLTLPTNREV